MPESKIVLIGPAGSGKTSLITCLLQGQINEQEASTIGAKFQRYQHSGTKLQLWDAGGQNQSLWPTYLKNAHVVLITCSLVDIENEDSASALERSLDLAKNHVPDAIIILVVTKQDLETSSYKRLLAERALEDLANEYNCLYAFASAKDKASIDWLFTQITNLLMPAPVLVPTPNPELVNEPKPYRVIITKHFKAYRRHYLAGVLIAICLIAAVTIPAIATALGLITLMGNLGAKLGISYVGAQILLSCTAGFVAILAPILLGLSLKWAGKLLKKTGRISEIIRDKTCQFVEQSSFKRIASIVLLPAYMLYSLGLIIFGIGSLFKALAKRYLPQQEKEVVTKRTNQLIIQDNDTSSTVDKRSSQIHNNPANMFPRQETKSGEQLSSNALQSNAALAI